MENANGVIKKLTSAERSYYTAAEVREMICMPLTRFALRTFTVTM